MRLADLEPQFVGAGGEGISDKDGNPVPRREGVALVFKCPCGINHDSIGESDLICLHFSNPLDGGSPLERVGHTWERTGDTFDTLTIRPSIQRLTGCRWHGFITDGEVTNA